MIMCKVRDRRGQAILEYLLVAVAVIAAVLAFSGTGGTLGTAITNIGDRSATGINNATAQISTMSPTAQ